MRTVISRHEWWVLLAVLLFGLLSEIAVLHDHSGVMIDDGYYYLKIARSIAEGKGPTFDGVNPTNGFHPLWLISLVPVFLFASDIYTANLLAAVLQVLLYLAGVAVLYLTARLYARPWVASLAPTLWVFLTYSLALTGLEFSLYALLVFVTAYFYLTRFRLGAPLTAQACLVLGILCSLTFLARLDSILFPLSFAPFLVSREWRAGWKPSWLVRLLAFGAPVLSTGVTYSVVNQIQFGHISSISSIVKIDWSAYRCTLDPANQGQGCLLSTLNHLAVPFLLLINSGHIAIISYGLELLIGSLGALVLLILAGVFWSRPEPIWGRLYISPVAPFALFSLLISLAYAIFLPYAFAYYRWYYVIQPWLATIMLTVLLEQVLRASEGSSTRTGSRRWVHGLGVTVALVLVCGVPLDTMRNLWVPSAQQMNPSPDPLYVTALWLRANTSQDAVVGSWSAGIIGYFSERRVINLDGLVNTWDYYESEQYDLCGYWSKNRVNYLADYFDGDQASSPVPSYPYYASCASKLQLVWTFADPRGGPLIHVYRINWADQ